VFLGIPSYSLFCFFRFKPLFERESFIIATSVHPRFKLNWIPKEDEVLEMNVRKLLRSKLEELNDMDFGTFDNSGDDPLDIPSRVSSVLNELDLFLVDQDKTLLSLNKYPRIKEIFLRFNTALPSSAPVERLFSAGPLILTIRRNRLSDCLFETLLILKVYKRI
jgi:hypothetical protein